MKKLFFLFLTTLMAVGMSATSTATINFSGKTSGGDYQALDKVLVENLTQGWNETITDVTMSIDILDEEAIDVVPAENGFVVSNDAFSGTAEVAFNMKNAGKVSVFVYNVTGQCICQSTTEQEAGYHTLNLEFGTPQIYYLHISTPNRKFSHSLLNMHAGSNTQIQYVTEMGEVRHMPLYAPAAHTCKAGDQMRYTGYTTYEGEEYTDEQRSVIAEGVTNIEFTFTFNSPVSTVYYIKHPWSGGEWTWQQMSYGANGFTYTGVWGGTGANVNMTADDNGSEWYPASAIEGASSVSNGETVTFTFVPTNGNVGTLSVSKGEPTPTTNYFIKHPWGGGEWTWQQMTADEGEYTYTGVWGGTGANISMTANDGDSKWYQASDIQGASSVSNGETVTFTFVPTNGNVGTLSVSKGEPTPTTNYFIKHPWGGGDWTWQHMTADEGEYTYTGVWGGTGANISMTANDGDSKWYQASDIQGASSVSEGDMVLFTFVPTNGNVGTLSVSKGEPTFTTNYYIKHPWGGGDWTWQHMTPGENGYTYSGAWGNNGANISMSSDGSGEKWYETSVIGNSSAATLGEEVQFVFVPTDGVIGNLSIVTSGGGGGGGEVVTPPSAPRNLSATAGSSCIVLSWSAVSDATKYTVYRSTSASGSYTYLSQTSSTSYNDCSVEKGTTYYYKVSASKNGVEGEKSSYAYATVPTGGGSSTTTPGTPTNVKVTVDGSCLKITWNAASNATEYSVFRSTSASSGYTNLQLTSGTSYKDCSVTAGTTYYYKVKAWNGNTDGSFSSSASGKVASSGGGGGTTTVSAPTNVKASYMLSNHSVQVTWTGVALCDSYEIYRANTATGSKTKKGTATTADGCVYIDKLASSDDQKTFYYFVKAKSSYLGKTSDYSEAASVYIDKNPVAPCPASNLSITGSSSLSISWSVQTQSGCGTPTEKYVQFYDYSSSASDKWVSEKVTTNSYSLTSTKLKQYLNGGSTLAGCIAFYNANGKSCLHFEYNTSTKKVTILSTNCYE